MEKSKIFEKKLIQKINKIGLYCLESDIFDIVDDYVQQVEDNKSTKFKDIEKGYLAENLGLKIDAISIAEHDIVRGALFDLFLSEFGAKGRRACEQDRLYPAEA